MSDNKIITQPTKKVLQPVNKEYVAPRKHLTPNNGLPTMSDLQEVLEKCDNPEAKGLAETLKIHNSVQISKDYLDDMGELAVHSPAAFRVLLFFIKYMNTDNNLSVPDITLQELLGYSEMTIKKAIKHLEENGWIVVWKKKGEANGYTVNKKVAVK